MAVSMGKKPGGRRTVAEINITPFTDVCLVLLIIFMVSANFLGPQRGLDVKLPEPSNDAPSDTRPVREVTINVAADSRITIDVTAADKVKTTRTVTFDTLIS
ncbi:MAG: biopolymer transporter ExbD, partial [Armatimonadota bacterium]|nr:biopolymer transporter ExbD [Armatimonadota bacterium]